MSSSGEDAARDVTRPAPSAARAVATKDFLSILDLSHDELERVLDLAAELKRERAAGRPGAQPLAGKHVALLFEKPSLRTRTTFAIAVRELGGEVIEPPADVAFGGRETRRGRRAQSRALGRRRRRPHVRAGAARAVRRRRAATCTSSTR